MDFPSREEARVYARLQGDAPPSAPAKPALAPPAPVAVKTPPPAPAPVDPPHPSAAPDPPSPKPAARPSRLSARESSVAADSGSNQPPDSARFRVEKPGFESDEYDRRALRNLIRTGEIGENDWIRVDFGKPSRAGDLPYLKSLFSLRKTAKVQPPNVCRTHTDNVAFFKCKTTGRPLCEECAPEKKFGSAIIRVCNHCGGTSDELVPLTTL